MERKIAYDIVHPLARQKVRGFLKCKGYSTQNLKVFKELPGSIELNGEAVFLNHSIKDGDVLTVHIPRQRSSEQILPVELPVDIVYEDEDLLVVNKAAGMPIHPSQNNRDNTLGNALAWYFAAKGEPFVFRCVSRLDRDTSGVTIVAKHMVSGGILAGTLAAKSKGDLSEKIPEEMSGKKNGGGTQPHADPSGIRRQYLAVVKGEVFPEQGTVTAPIGRKESSCLERQVDFTLGERAVTHYRVLGRSGGCSLVLLELETGRTHQIRVHMAYLGHPLVGDFLYGAEGEDPRAEGIGRQALHAYRLRFAHPMTGEPMEFTAPLPKDMRRLLEEKGFTSWDF